MAQIGLSRNYTTDRGRMHRQGEPVYKGSQREKLKQKACYAQTSETRDFQMVLTDFGQEPFGENFAGSQLFGNTIRVQTRLIRQQSPAHHGAFFVAKQRLA